MPPYRLFCFLLFLNAPVLGFTQNIEITDSLWAEFLKSRIVEIENNAYALAKKGAVTVYNYWSDRDTVKQSELEHLGKLQCVSPVYIKNSNELPEDILYDTVVFVHWEQQTMCGLDFFRSFQGSEANPKIGLRVSLSNIDHCPEDTFTNLGLDYRDLINQLNPDDRYFLESIVELIVLGKIINSYPTVSAFEHDSIIHPYMIKEKDFREFVRFDTFKDASEAAHLLNALLPSASNQNLSTFDLTNITQIAPHIDAYERIMLSQFLTFVNRRK